MTPRSGVRLPRTAIASARRRTRLLRTERAEAVSTTHRARGSAMGTLPFFIHPWKGHASAPPSFDAPVRGSMDARVRGHDGDKADRPAFRPLETKRSRTRQGRARDRRIHDQGESATRES